MKQGLTLLERVLQFYPIMQEGTTSTVTLTEQDWMVLMDFTDNPATTEILPAKVKGMTADRGARVINVITDDCNVQVKMGF